MPRVLPRRLAAICVCFLPTLPLAAAEAGDALTPEQVVDLAQVDDLALAPDGRTIAYTLDVQRPDGDDPGESYHELWLVGTGGGAPRAYVTGKVRVTDPAFSPDGARVSYLAKRAEIHAEIQIYAIATAGGESQPLTTHPTRVREYRWSPDGAHIAYVATAALRDEQKQAREAGRDWTVVDEDAPQRELWLLELESGETRRLLADRSVWELAWIDDRSLVVQASKTPRTDDSYMFLELQRVAIDSEDVTRIVPTEGKLGHMAVSPDGEQLAWAGASSFNDPLAQSVFVAALDGGTPRNLTSGLEASVADVHWLAPGRLLALVVDGSGNGLFEIDAATGERQPQPWPGLVVGHLKLGTRDGRPQLAATASAPEHPAEVFAARPGEAPARLTRSNPGLDGVRLAKQEVTEWTGADGWPISGVLTYPVDYRPGERYPLVLQLHGGPEGVSLNGWRSRPTYPVQVLAAQGWFVLEPNYRGSQGRGVEFSKADHDDLGGREFEDVLAGVDVLIERGLVDPDRVGTGGWSYGGYFSAWAATRHSERFAAAIACAGISNWISFAGTTDIPHEMSVVHWNSYWYDEPELHWQRSPLAHLESARTPTLIVHGEKDERVHPEQSLQLYTALRLQGTPTRLVLYPREEHGLSERANELDYIERIVDWFAEHLGRPEASSRVSSGAQP